MTLLSRSGLNSALCDTSSGRTALLFAATPFRRPLVRPHSTLATLTAGFESLIGGASELPPAIEPHPSAPLFRVSLGIRDIRIKVSTPTALLRNGVAECLEPLNRDLYSSISHSSLGVEHAGRLNMLS